jgi:hypothetical protein
MAKGQTVILGNAFSRARAHRLIEAAPNGHVMNVREPTRSTAQNDKMWAMLGDVSVAKPEGRRLTPDDWKAVFMNACGWEVQFLEGLDGRPFPSGFRSSHMTVKQMADLITFIQAYGDQHGVAWTKTAEVEAA